MVSSIVSSFETSSLLMMRVIRRNSRIDGDRDLFRDDGRAVQNVRAVSESELQHVAARHQRYRDFRLAASEMHVVLVHGDGDACGRQVAVDEQMMMPGSRSGRSRRCDSHARKAELNQHGTLHMLAVLQIDEIFLRARRGSGLRKRKSCGNRHYRRGGKNFHSHRNLQCLSDRRVDYTAPKGAGKITRPWAVRP